MMSKNQPRNRRLPVADGKEKSSIFYRLCRRLAVSVGILAAVLLIVASAYFGINGVRSVVDRPVAEISVESNFDYVDRRGAMNLINNTLRQNFLSENLQALKIGLESDPWIEHVVLSRQWPDHLHVKIIEQAPIARWSDTGFVNYRGELVEVDDIERLQHLPLLAGPTDDAAEVLKQYQAIAKLLRKYDLEIASLMKSQHHRWTVELTNGWQINIGKGQLMEKMQRFSVVLKNHLPTDKKDAVAVIDMRYQHGVAVRWLEIEETVPTIQVSDASLVSGI